MALVPLALRRDPLEVLACLASEPGALLLEVPDPERPVTLIGCRQVAELALHPGDREPLAALARFVAETAVADPALPFPLGGGVVACLCYELGVEVAPRRITHRSTTPLAVLRRYDPLLVYDRRRTQYALLAQHPAAARARWLERLSGTAPHLEGALGAAPLSAATSAACPDPTATISSAPLSMSAFTPGRSASSNAISPAFSGPRCRTFPRDNGTLSGFCVLLRTVVDMPASSWCFTRTLRETDPTRNASRERRSRQRP